MEKHRATELYNDYDRLTSTTKKILENDLLILFRFVTILNCFVNTLLSVILTNPEYKIEFIEHPYVISFIPTLRFIWTN